MNSSNNQQIPKSCAFPTNNSYNFNNINPNKSFQNNVFKENFLYTPKIIENDDDVKKNITEQIKNVNLKINILIFFNF